MPETFLLGVAKRSTLIFAMARNDCEPEGRRPFREAVANSRMARAMGRISAACRFPAFARFLVAIAICQLAVALTVSPNRTGAHP